MEEEVRQAFLNRPRFVEKATGFLGLEVSTDAKDPCVFLLLTRWSDEESFRAWHRSESHHTSHVLIPKGLKLDPAFTSLTIGNSIQPSTLVQTLGDAIAKHSDAVTDWLVNSETVVALLLSPDGTIRERNRAAQRIFPANFAGISQPRIWDYLVCSGDEHLRRRLSESESAQDSPFLLNLADGDQSPVTWEARLLHRDASFLLLAT
jgi:quinol monooxygenase YgiN